MAGQREKKMSRLLEKAEELFMQYGYSRVSMDQIAGEAGISKMTIYKYFPSKDELFLAVMGRMSSIHTVIIMDMLNKKEHTLDKIESLYQYITTLSKQLPSDLAAEIIERPYLMEKIKEMKQENSLKMWRYILEDGIQKGEIRPVDVEFVSVLLLNLPLVFMRSEYMNEESSRQWFYEKLFDFVKYGLLGGVTPVKAESELQDKEGSQDAASVDES